MNIADIKQRILQQKTIDDLVAFLEEIFGINPKDANTEAEQTEGLNAEISPQGTEKAAKNDTPLFPKSFSFVYYAPDWAKVQFDVLNYIDQVVNDGFRIHRLSGETLCNDGKWHLNSEIKNGISPIWFPTLDEAIEKVKSIAKAEGLSEEKPIGLELFQELTSKTDDINEVDVCVEYINQTWDEERFHILNTLFDTHTEGYRIFSLTRGTLLDNEQWGTAKENGSNVLWFSTVDEAREYLRVFAESQGWEEEPKTVSESEPTQPEKIIVAGNPKLSYTVQSILGTSIKSSSKEIDAILRKDTATVWLKASKAEKDALYGYTEGSGKYNRPLRGYAGPGWTNYLGPGKVDLNNEWAGAAIDRLTNVIDRCSYSKDIMLKREVSFAGADAFFNLPQGAFQKWPLKKLRRALIDKNDEELEEGRKKWFLDEGFVSCCSSYETSFNSDVIYHIFCPKGTNMIYVEPFSAYGKGAGRMWDGRSTQEKFGQECETIIQRGTTFKVIEITSNSLNKITVVMVAIKQRNSE